MYKQLLSTLSLAAIITGCGAGGIVSEGGSETGGEELPVPGTEVVCVEMMPGVKTCWVDWLPGVDARVILECLAADKVTSLDWSPAYEDVLPYWGMVLCHDVIGTAGAVCLYGDSRVQLTEEPEGWLPHLDLNVGFFPSVEPPCEDVCDPSVSDPTCPAGQAGCECTCEDLNEDGMTPGECYPGAGLECVDGQCEAGPALCEEKVERAVMIDIITTNDGKQGTWEGCVASSRVVDRAGLEMLPYVESGDLWPCAPSPDVDVCVQIDPERVGCFWFVDAEHAVAVAPACAVSTEFGWGHIGSGMMAKSL